MEKNIKKMDKDNFAILVNTCDAYSDAWDMFLYLLKINWEGKMPKVYFNSESKAPSNTILEVCTLNSEIENINWGERLLNCLKKIEEEYVLMMLEDFYYENPINTYKIYSALEYMKNNQDIMAFQFIPAGKCHRDGYVNPKSYYEGYARRDRFDNFKIIAGPTLWRKKDLIRLTQRNDSPWDWEYFGSFRTWFYGKHIYCWWNYSEPIFEYDIIHGGAIHRGSWVGYKMEELQKKYNYHLEYGNRKVIWNWLDDYKITKETPRYKRLKSIIYNRVKMISNIVYGIKLWLLRNKEYV